MPLRTKHVFAIRTQPRNSKRILEILAASKPQVQRARLCLTSMLNKHLGVDPTVRVNIAMRYKTRHQRLFDRTLDALTSK